MRRLVSHYWLCMKILKGLNNVSWSGNERSEVASKLVMLFFTFPHFFANSIHLKNDSRPDKQA